MKPEEIRKEYISTEVEERWIAVWDESVYYFDNKSADPQYIIDTPPPYPTGDFHIGNAINWCYIDFVARYKRMRGFNVMFPQGWDCHGLPTEVKVEEIHKITKNEIPREEFRRLCEELTTRNIKRMRGTMRRLGFSTDWSNEYITMSPDYYVKTQRSFVRMYDQGMIYREDHPVNWCPRCATAIAFAEVEYDSRVTTLNYMWFGSDLGDLLIATSRPELLPACVAVAVHPEDERYEAYIDRMVTVPVFNYAVPVVADDKVDPNFGTGVVMICTFGDKQDVRWWVEHDLPLRQVIGRNGRMTDLALKYAGLSVQECKEKILAEMEGEGIIFKQEPLEQNVGLCWRCKTPIEILSERQWFTKINPDDIINVSSEIDWVPEYMETRLLNWTGTMEWDWCISRQRIFATPIPVWYCKQCGRVMVAKEEWLPLDPMQTMPSAACICGSREFEPEPDVLDTWMDSSISALNVCGWLGDGVPRYPAQLRPQGHDIIRTWAFYTILRTKALVGTRPWDTILINGMVLGEDGRKMSKSLNNFISPEEVIEKYGADALRQWAAIGGSTGSDVMFRWKDVISGGRFLQKLWSIYRFAAPFAVKADARCGEVTAFGQVDRWLLGELDNLVIQVTNSMERYQFDESLRAIRAFAWEILADNYIELVKARLYGPDGPEKQSAQNTFYIAIDTVARLLAPFVPFIAEEIYHGLTGQSVHTASWPTPLGIKTDYRGLLVREISAAIRRYKSERGMALNAPLSGIEVYTDWDLETLDLSGSTNSHVDVKRGVPELEKRLVKLIPQMKHIGPRFKDDSKRVIEALNRMDPEDLLRARSAGKVEVHLGNNVVEITREMFEIETLIYSAGRAVELLSVQDATILIRI